MKILFVTSVHPWSRSVSTVQKWIHSGRALGYEIAVYGDPIPQLPSLPCTRDLSGVDIALFVLQVAWDIPEMPGLAHLLDGIPREKRVVVDLWGRFNDTIRVEHDFNHLEKLDEHQGWEWMDAMPAFSKTILQPTLSAKDYAMTYLGHTKFRWRGMSKVLRALEPVRSRMGRVTLVGDGWGEPTKWEQWFEVRDDHYVDRDYLKRLRVETVPPVPYAQVLAAMSQAVFNPVVYRPLFEHLRFVTCRTFETPAAGTIPLFVLAPDYVREIYGAPAVELVLGDERPHEKILDVLARPEHYAEIVIGIREKFRRLHSPEARMRELLAYIEE